MRSTTRPSWSTTPSRARTALAALLVSGLAMLGVTAGVALPASAHTPTVSADCQAVHVSLVDYDGSADNTVTVTIDGTAVVTETFAASYVADIPAPTGVAGYSWSVDVAAHDDPGNSLGYSRHFGGTVDCSTPPSNPPTTPPAPPSNPPAPPTDPSNPPTPPVDPPTGLSPSIALTAEPCTIGSTGDGVSDVVASLSDLVVGDDYRVSIGDGTGDVADAVEFTATSTTRTVRFDDLPVDTVYTVVVLDATTGLSAEAQVDPVDCAGTPVIAVSASPCYVLGGSTVQFTVTLTDLTPGRTYRITVPGAPESPLTLVAGASGTEVRGFAAPTGTEVRASVTDVDAGVTTFASPVTTVDCPSAPNPPSATVETCGTGQTSTVIHAEFTGLTPGRSYRILLDGATQGPAFVAGSGTVTRDFTVVPGPHTIGIRDQSDYTTVWETPVDVPPCAEEPTVAIEAQQCTTPDGPAGLSTEITDLVIGREYRAELTSGGLPVAGHPAVTFVATTTSVSSQLDLPPGAEYTLTVTDTAYPDATDSVSAVLEECPEVLGISVEADSCSVGSVWPTVWVEVRGIERGDIYTIRLTDAATGELVAERTGVDGDLIAGALAPGAVLGGAAAAAAIGLDPLHFDGLTAGNEYLVTLVSESGRGTAVASIVPSLCELPTFPLPEPPAQTQLETLALTGSDDPAPGIVALVLVQAGLALLLVTSIRRRRAKGA